MDRDDTIPRSDDLPLFPTTAPAELRRPSVAKALLDAVLNQLAAVAEVEPHDRQRPTPCATYAAADLQRHVVGWLRFFAAALRDPDAATERPDPQGWSPEPGRSSSEIVREAAADIAVAIDAGVAERIVVMSQARMAGDGVLAMALGEYLVHGWDLAVATGREWPIEGEVAAAVEPAHAFLRTMVSPEYRGPASGFFDAEVPAAPDATPFERLLCFAGRDPRWAAPAPDA